MKRGLSLASAFAALALVPAAQAGPHIDEAVATLRTSPGGDFGGGGGDF